MLAALPWFLLTVFVGIWVWREVYISQQISRLHQRINQKSEHHHRGYDRYGSTISNPIDPDHLSPQAVARRQRSYTNGNRDHVLDQIHERVTHALTEKYGSDGCYYEDTARGPYWTFKIDEVLTKHERDYVVEFYQDMGWPAVDVIELNPYQRGDDMMTEIRFYTKPQQA